MNIASVFTKSSGSAGETYLASLYYGKGGEALFLIYMHLLTKDDHYLVNATKTLNAIIKDLESKPYPLGLAYGASGVAWLLQHIINLGYYKDENLDYLNTVDIIIEKSLENDVHNKNYDLFHGLIGKGMYFLESYERTPDVAHRALSEIVKSLDKLKSTGGNIGITWKDFDTDDEGEIIDYSFNLGIPHGIPGIILFLTEVYEKNILKSSVESLLRESCAWVLDTKVENSTSQFPPALDDKHEPIEPGSRLAWCYGDIGISLALLKSAITLKDPLLKKKAIDIALHSTNRKLGDSDVFLKDDRYPDCGFCHGLCGIALLYNSMYYITRMREFEQAQNYWLNLLYESIDHNELIFHDYNATTKKVTWPHNKHDLLEGMSGVGLTLLTVSNTFKNDFYWRNAFFITGLHENRSI